MDPEPFRSTTATLMRRNPLWLGLGASPWAIGVFLITAALISHNYKILAGLGHALIFGVLGLVFAYKYNRNPSYEAGEITADPTGVRIGGRLLATRDDIRDGFVLPYKGRTVVRLRRSGRTSINIAVEDIAEGRRLLKALGLDATQTVARVRAASQVFSMPSWKQLALFLAPVALVPLSIVSATLLGGKHGLPFGFAVIPFVYAFMFTMLLAPTSVRIGADGIVTRWLGKERYFPFKDIEWVNPYEGAQLNKTYVGVEIVTRAGETTRILTGQKRWGDEQQGLLIERIREAIEAYRSGYAGADASVLARNGRAPKDWVTALRAIGAGANADMRTAGIPLDRLWRLVEDASAAPLARVGAAIALTPQIPPSERRRIRIAAEATASPKLRIALERASSNDTPEEELAEELSALEAEA